MNFNSVSVKDLCSHSQKATKLFEELLKSVLEFNEINQELSPDKKNIEEKGLKYLIAYHKFKNVCYEEKIKLPREIGFSYILQTAQ